MINKILAILYSNRLKAYTIGLGMVLFVVHNPQQPFIDVFFLPPVGVLLIYMGILMSMNDIKKQSFGPKWLYIPLLLIVGSIVASVASQGFTGLILALFGVSLFGIYLVARTYGEAIFIPFIWAVIIGTIGMLIYGIVSPGVKTGGFISPTNYDMATGLLVFGTLVSIWKRQWILTAVAIVGLFFTGADEAIFVVAFMGLVLILRRDVGKKALLPIGALAITLIIATPLGITRDLYFPGVQKVATLKEAVEDTAPARVLDNVVPDIITSSLTSMALVTREETSMDEALNLATGFRWLDYWRLSPIKLFGYGFNVNNFYPGIPHNVPMIIIEQIGIIGALAWVWVVGYCLVKTKWRYAWLGVISLSVFDHFIWTQAAPWFWALAGASTVSNIKGDLIFRRSQQ